MIIARALRNDIQIIRKEKLTSRMVGAKVAVNFTSDWNGLTKTAIFSCGDISRAVLETEWDGKFITVPWEVLRYHGQHLTFGVFGVNANGTVAIPTIYADLGLVERGANPDADPSAEPTLPVYAQIQKEIGNLDKLETDNKNNLVEAINEAATTGGEGGTGDHTKLKNRDAADQHPMSAITGLASALEGKQPAGEYLTPNNLQSATNAALAQAKASGEFDGAPGAKGEPGKAATIQVGRVTTGAAGTPASVSNVGTDEAAVFDFTIPQGEKGADAAADLALGITAAQPGQIAKITAVDASGAPTAWEPVDMASGGGGEASDDWEFVQSFKLSPDTALYELASVAEYRAIRINVVRGTANNNLGSGNLFLRVATTFSRQAIIVGLATSGYHNAYYFFEAHADKAYSWATAMGSGNNVKTISAPLGFGVFSALLNDYDDVFSDMAKCVYELLYAKPAETIDGAETVYVYGVRR